MDFAPKEFLFSSWDQIRGLDPSRLEIGCHTKTHPNCTRLSTEEEFKEELEASRIEIARRVGYEITHFNFPTGDFNDETIAQVKRFGYRSAVSVIPGFNDRSTDRYRLKRLPTDEDFLLFKAFVSGTYVLISRVWVTMRSWR